MLLFTFPFWKSELKRVNESSQVVSVSLLPSGVFRRMLSHDTELRFTQLSSSLQLWRDLRWQQHFLAGLRPRIYLRILKMKSYFYCLMAIWKTVFDSFQSLIFPDLPCVHVYCYESVRALEERGWRWQCP